MPLRRVESCHPNCMPVPDTPWTRYETFCEPDCEVWLARDIEGWDCEVWNTSEGDYRYSYVCNHTEPVPNNPDALRYIWCHGPNSPSTTSYPTAQEAIAACEEHITKMG